MRERNELLVLKAEIAEDIKAIENIVLKTEQRQAELQGEAVDFFDTAGFGYLLHNFYNACESILLRIAKVFENTVEEDTWHKDLLSRMKLDIKGIRPPVISDELLTKLDEYRRFRHLFRHSYALTLEWEKLNALIINLKDTKSSFINAITNFLEFVDTLLKRLS